MKSTADLMEAIATGEDHSAYSCSGCSWCDNEADLQLCPKCQRRLVCHECRDSNGHCYQCNDYELPPEVEIVGCHDSCDVMFTVCTWREMCFASHWYVDIRAPYKSDQFGKLDLDRFHQSTFRTEKHGLLGSYIRRMVKLMVRRHAKAISRRKDGKFYVRVDNIDALRSLYKAQLSRPLDGD